MNKSMITGRITADPELNQTKSGIPVTSFTVAVQRRFDKDKTDFIDVVAWRQTAEFICKHFRKGKRIEICGALQTRNYTNKDGVKMKAYEIHADEVSFGGDKVERDKAKDNKASNTPPEPDFIPSFGTDIQFGDADDWTNIEE